jgi:putative transposase
LTFCTFGKRELFKDGALVDELLSQLRSCADRFHFAVIVYCFMPDHFHVLIEGTSDDADLQEFVRIWKQQTSFDVKRDFGVKLWQRGYYEHILRGDESLEKVARYILENPVRKGLVQSPDEYPYLGSFVTTVEDLMLRAQDVPGPSNRKLGPT